MGRELIDPLNENTYDDRVIVHSGIKTPVPTEAYRRGWERVFSKKLHIKFIFKMKRFIIVGTL